MTSEDTPTISNLDLEHVVNIYEAARAYVELTYESLRHAPEVDHSTVKEYNESIDSVKYLGEILNQDVTIFDQYYL